MTAPISIEEARRIVAEADKDLYWPQGSHVISRFGTTHPNCNGGFWKKDECRELTPMELDILKQIPEIANEIQRAKP